MITVIADRVSRIQIQLNHEFDDTQDVVLLIKGCPNDAEIPLVGTVCEKRFTTDLNLLCDGSGYGNVVEDIGTFYAELYTPDTAGTLVARTSITVYTEPQKIC